MDGKWTLPVVSTACHVEDYAIGYEFSALFPELRNPSTSDFVVEQVRGLTSSLIRKHSYCPATWTARARNLLRMGYPDLAIGDAYKAKILLDLLETPNATLRPKIEEEIERQMKESIMQPRSNGPTIQFQEYVETVKERAFMTLAQGLFLASCFIECYEFLKEAIPKQRQADIKMHQLKDLAERAQLVEDASRVVDEDYVSDNDVNSEEVRRSGSIMPQTYPWAEPYVQRNDYTLTTSKGKMYEFTQNRCCIQVSSIADGVSTTNTLEEKARTLGIKANIDLPNGAPFLVDYTFLSGIDESLHRCSSCRCQLDDRNPSLLEALCCHSRYCSKECLHMANNYHYSVCSLPSDITLNWKMRLNSGTDSPDTIATQDLLYRLFAHIENKPSVHPLRIPLVNAMVPSYRNTRPVPFSLENDIRRPFTILELLGVDIFKDHGHDTWVIQTIQARLRNNARAFEDSHGRYLIVVNPLYMFFNHSCDPNVEIETHESGSTHVVAKTTKPVARHEELFINYIGNDDLALPYAERQKLLKDWTGGECLCQRCKRERRELEREQSPPVPAPREDSSDEDYVEDEE